MVVVDTSVWVDHFRARHTPATATLERLIEAKADIAVTEAILMEVLAGASSHDIGRIRELLLGRPMLRLHGVADFEAAASLYRECRAAGETLRNQLDSLIAVPVIRETASLLHNDRDFDAIARHSTLRIEPVSRASENGGASGLREAPGKWRRLRHPRRTTGARESLKPMVRQR